jgi:hypothetical protein
LYVNREFSPDIENSVRHLTLPAVIGNFQSEFSFSGGSPRISSIMWVFRPASISAGQHPSLPAGNSKVCSTFLISGRHHEFPADTSQTTATNPIVVLHFHLLSDPDGCRAASGVFEQKWQKSAVTCHCRPQFRNSVRHFGLPDKVFK